MQALRARADIQRDVAVVRMRPGMHGSNIERYAPCIGIVRERLRNHQGKLKQGAVAATALWLQMLNKKRKWNMLVSVGRLQHTFAVRQ